MKTLKIPVENVYHVENTRISLESRLFTRGCYRRNLGVGFTWIMPSTSWETNGWCWRTRTYSKYPCIHQTNSVSAKSTTDLLEIDFAHFGYPHTLVTDNASAFMSEEFQSWCRKNGIVHLTGAPYHPATNGAVERLIQTFKQSLMKSILPPKKALQEFDV